MRWRAGSEILGQGLVPCVSITVSRLFSLFDSQKLAGDFAPGIFALHLRQGVQNNPVTSRTVMHIFIVQQIWRCHPLCLCEPFAQLNLREERINWGWGRPYILIRSRFSTSMLSSIPP